MSNTDTTRYFTHANAARMRRSGRAAGYHSMRAKQSHAEVEAAERLIDNRVAKNESGLPIDQLHRTANQNNKVAFK